ncbi:glycerol kinase [Limosa lapponica baueri]|uniref:Glycerol kinase n=1 Tax=Limosa lapponica baueri TaxID=1758121 RepID=A0A2I0UAA0_LIMLA|nr:glycerol kinase [Limosa lapponica baueri]
MDEERTGSLRSGLKGGQGQVTLYCGSASGHLIRKTKCMRPSTDRQTGAASRSRALVLMGDFNHHDTCWRDNTSGLKQSRMFLECVDDNFLLQVTEQPMRRGAMLDLILTNKEGLVGKVKLKRSIGCSDYDMVEFKTLRAVRKAHSKITLDFRTTDFGLFRDLLGRVPWDNALEGRGAQERWLIFKDRLFQAQERRIQIKRKSGKPCM